MDKYLKTGNASWNGTGDSSNGALGYSKLQHNQGYRPADYSNKHQNKEEITEDLAKKWEGWGTALKPALEPITVARKPIEGNVAQNCLKWGVGGINIDGCRVGTNPGYKYRADANGTTFHGQQGERIKQTAEKKGSEFIESTLGRFPANLIHDGSDEVVGLFPQTKSGGGNKNSVNNQEDSFLGTGFGGTGTKTDWKIDSGSASRFFYCAKASKRERNRGCEDMEEKQTVGGGGGIGNYLDDVNSASGKYGSEKAPSKNNHPTVKPIALMEYLVKLVSKEGHTVLDPFMGSGSTGIACKKLGREFIGIEKENDYCKIAEARIGAVQTVQEKLYD
jgi:site-specific DNA-methyltransferase (adenine-specific)